MKLKPDRIQLAHSEDWPLYLSLEQREQLLSEKFARAVAAVKAAPHTIAKNVILDQHNNRNRDRGIRI